MRVGIIGGGIGGLAAAYDLGKQGHAVAVYERAPFLGGLASTFEVGGGRLERFYHHLFLSDKSIIALLEELGLADRLIWKDSTVGFYYRGRIYPFSTPMDLLKFTPVGLVDRVRMGLVTLYLQRVKHWQKFEDRPAAAFMRKWVGKRNYEVVWGPLLQGKFTKYKEEIGMPWLWSKFATRVSSRDKTFKEKLAYIGGSWGVLIDALEERVRAQGGEVHINTAVTRVLTENGRVTGLTVQGMNGRQRQEPFDAILATIPSFALPRLVDLPADYLAKVEGVEYEGAIAVIWVLKHSLSPIYWLNISDPEIPFLLALEQTNLVPPETYGGKHVLYTANYVTREDKRWGMDAEAIVEDYLPHLKKINAAFDRSWVEAYYLHKEPAAQPIMKVGYAKRMPSPKTPIGGLWLASMSQVYPEDRGTNYSIKLAVEVGRQAVAEALEKG